MSGGLALVVVVHDSAPELQRLLDSVARHLPVEPQVGCCSRLPCPCSGPKGSN